MFNQAILLLAALTLFAQSTFAAIDIEQPVPNLWWDVKDMTRDCSATTSCTFSFSMYQVTDLSTNTMSGTPVLCTITNPGTFDAAIGQSGCGGNSTFTAGFTYNPSDFSQGMAVVNTLPSPNYIAYFGWGNSNVDTTSVATFSVQGPNVVGYKGTTESSTTTSAAAATTTAVSAKKRALSKFNA